jgi:hypothetical protein
MANWVNLGQSTSNNQETGTWTEIGKANKIIKPTTKTPKKEEKKANIFGTTARALTSVGQGILGFAEGIGDTLQYNTAKLLDLGLLNVPFAKRSTEKEISNRLVEGAKMDSTQLITGKAQQTYDPYAYKPFKTGGVGDQILQGVGQVAGQVGSAGLLGTAGLASKIANYAPTAISSYGSGVSQGLSKGQSMGKSVLYGLGNAAIQTGSEALFGGIGGVLGKGALDDVVVNSVTNKIKSSIGKNLARIGIKSVGEGLEENIAGVLDPILQRLTIDEKAKFYSGDQALQDFVIGAATSALLQSPSITQNNAPTQTNVQDNINTLTTPQTPQQEAITQPQEATRQLNEISAMKEQNNDAIVVKGQPNPETNILPQGAEPRAREIALPKETEGGKTAQFAQTAAESSALDDTGALRLKQEVEQGKLAYVPLSDEKALNNANNVLEINGYDNSLTTLKTKFQSGERMNKNDIVLGERLIQEAIKAQDYETATDLIGQVAVLGSELGQQVQALYLIKKLTPEGRLKTLQTIVNRENQTNKNLKGRKIVVAQEDAQAILSSQTQEDLDNAVDNAMVNIANQMPLTRADKIRSWRYLSMLGNPRTHIRNVVANTAMLGTTKTKNILASAMEDIIKPIERTKTLQKSSPEVMKFVEQDAINNAERIQGQDKYDLKSKLNLQKRAFDNKLLNKLAEGNSWLLNQEDIWFSTPAYKSALAGYITANKMDINNLDPVQIERGRQYAINQAQEQTFRQVSKIANAIARFEDTNALTKIGVGAVLPFKKTPLNIAKTGVEYSPIGFVNGMVKLIKDTKQGKPTAQTIDTIAKGTTGTGIMAIGYVLASMGLLRGSGSDEDKEEYFQQAQGEQPYSLRIGNKSYTLDWLSPTAMPLFAGVEMYEIMTGKSKGDATKLASFVDGMSKITDPLTQMSMLQGLNNTIQSYNTKGFLGSVGAVGLNAAQNYASQFIPTISGQLARTLDDTRRTTTAGGTGIDKTIGTFANKIKAKIPGLENTLEPYTDIYGREQKTGGAVERAFQNFLSPGYLKDMNVTKVDKEIQKLYNATGETAVLPSASSRYFTINGEKVNLTPKEYTEFNKTDGKYVLKNLNDLFNNSAYKRATDEEKQKAIERIYRAGQAVAKQQYLKNKEK